MGKRSIYRIIIHDDHEPLAEYLSGTSDIVPEVVLEVLDPVLRLTPQSLVKEDTVEEDDSTEYYRVQFNHSTPIRVHFEVKEESLYD